MALLTWPPPVPDGIYSLRFYETGTATGSFDDTKFSFVLPTDDTEQAWSRGIVVRASGGTLEISFDGTNVHGSVASGTEQTFWDRYEGGISVKGMGVDFVIAAW